MKTIYSLLIIVYGFLAFIASPFSSKASQWTKGRRGWRKKVRDFDRGDGKVIWMHCASLGEFEQGRPLLEKIKSEIPSVKIVLTFFSPSGYEIRRNYQHADIVLYLPSDLPANARFFIRAIAPDIALFVKYEFWYNYLDQLRGHKVPVYLISGIFRPSQYFFRWYGRYTRKMFSVFSHIFVQDELSEKLLASIGADHCTVTGDTRFDRVGQIASAAGELPLIRAFRGGGKLLVAGSSWEPDEDIIIRYINEHPGSLKVVFAPHLIDEAHLARIEKKLKVPGARYSSFSEGDTLSQVLIIDNIGILSSVYRYASVAAVGGGFGKGIHNLLEPASWGIPVLFGPNHTKFREAADLIACGGGFSFRDYDDFSAIVEKYTSDNEALNLAGEASARYVSDNQGATIKVFNKIIS